MTIAHRDAPWTYDDLLVLPDDGRRYEIIEGTLYEMTGPNGAHILTASNLIMLLLPLVQRAGGRLVTAVADVFFSGADPVEPDIAVLLPGGAVIAPRGIEGAPDLIVEVMSPGNRAHDLLTKRGLYERGGVREYWLVDPTARTVEILTLEDGRYRSLGVAADDAPVASPLLAGEPFAAGAAFAGLDELPA
ncbi:MAG TPA: Uma2 family endonuclease [Thermomicrobiales bacterium]|jgi:Uma2 family endonuclease|nr:Uma2 family endonuclease [Thermomicrobiales bacterium]